MGMSIRNNLITFSFVLVAITMFIASPVMAADFYVAAGGADYSGGDGKSLTKSNGCSDSKTPCGTITHATALAKSGDVINLGPGLFSRGEAFPLFIRKGVTLQGSLDGSTIIEGSDTNALVVVEADSPDIDTKTIIRNITIQGNYEGAGLSIGAGGDGPMQNGLIKSGGNGIFDALTFSTGTYNLTSSAITSGVYIHVTGSNKVANVSLVSNILYSNAIGVTIFANSNGIANVNLRNNDIFKNDFAVYAIAYNYGVANINMTANNIYYNSFGVLAGGMNGTANLYMRSNTVNSNSGGIYAGARSGGLANLTILNNQINSNSSFGMNLFANAGATAGLYIKSNTISKNGPVGFQVRAGGSGVIDMTALNNQFSNNSYAGLMLYAIGNASVNGILKNNSINGNLVGAYVGGSNASINMVLSRNNIASNYAGFFALARGTSSHNVYLKNNIFSNYLFGVFGYGVSSNLYINAGPYGAKTGLNTFNNITNNILDNGAIFTTTNNWWDAGEAVYNLAGNLPLDDPLLCAASSVTTSGGTTTISAASGTTYFVDKVGALPIRLTVTINGVGATVGAVAANQTSLTATAPAMAAGTYTLTVTNAGGQICTTTITYTKKKVTTTTNSPPYDATGGGTDWLYYPEDAQTNVPTGTVIKWTELTDANGDPITYTLYLCHADDWDADANDCTNWIEITGITANGGAATAGVALAANGMATAGGAILFAIGFIGAIRSRKGRAFMMALMMIASAGMIASCSTDDDSTDSDDSAATYTVCTDEAGIICEDINTSYTLDADTEYHWYVNAADGNGGSTKSDTRSFTTGSQ